MSELRKSDIEGFLHFLLDEGFIHKNRVIEWCNPEIILDRETPTHARDQCWFVSKRELMDSLLGEDGYSEKSLSLILSYLKIRWLKDPIENQHQIFYMTVKLEDDHGAYFEPVEPGYGWGDALSSYTSCLDDGSMSEENFKEIVFEYIEKFMPDDPDLKQLEHFYSDTFDNFNCV